MPPRHEELTGVYRRTRNVFQPDDPEERTVIAELDDAACTTIKGRATNGDLESGLTYRFLGRWVTHPVYGRQFHFTSFALATPSGERATIKYLARGPGIGHARARQIWKAFGERSLEVCRTEPHEIAATVKGIDASQAEEIAVYFKQFEKLERVTIEVNDLLAGKGFPRSLPDKVIKTWGMAAPSVIRNTPYKLMQFRGAGFQTTDRLYLEQGHDPAAIERQAYCLHHAMATSGDGSTWHTLPSLAVQLRQAISTGRPNMDAAIEWGVKNCLIATHKDRAGNVTHLAQIGHAVAEQRLAEGVWEAIRDGETGTPRWPTLEGTAENDGRLTIHQAEQATLAMQGFIGLLCGSPGTGKTFTLAQILKAIQSQEGAARIAVAAPTGKAAVRATESLAAQGVKMTATTIHRLLGVARANEQEGDRETGWGFDHNESNPLPLDFLFIDEASMIDTSLAASLFAARPAGCHVLLIGDPDQLAPVGHGAPLRDLIAAGLPKGHLTEIMRNAGRIVRSCAEIRDKQRCTFSQSLILNQEQPENLVLSVAIDPESAIEGLEQVINGAATIGVPDGEPHRDRVWGCQVVVPVNDKSPLARKALNKHLQQLLNPNGETMDGLDFRVGDKVCCLKNGTYAMLDGEVETEPEAADVNPKASRYSIRDFGKFNRTKNAKPSECYVANGELAKVKELAPGYIILELTSPRRVIRVPRGASADGESGGGSISNFDLAYALSVHKSQGSEWPVVVIMADAYGGARRVMDRHWVYTAISRAKEYAVCIGQRKIVDAAIRQSYMWKRKTFLKETIDAMHLDAALCFMD